MSPSANSGGFLRDQTTGALIVAPPIIADTWVAVGFHDTAGNGQPDSRAFGYVSPDGVYWKQIGVRPIFTSPTGIFRDGSLLWRNGLWYMAYTSGNLSVPSTLPQFLIVSSPDLFNWTVVATVDMTTKGVPACTKVWAPEWFVDGTSVWIINSVELSASNLFLPYAMQASSTDLSSWGNATAINWFDNPNMNIDMQVVKVGNVYHGFSKRQSTELVHHGTATNLLGPYTAYNAHTGDWAGFGSPIEGQTCVALADGTFALYVDKLAYGQSRFRPLDASLNPTGVVARANFPGRIRHAGIVRTRDAAANYVAMRALQLAPTEEEWHVAGDATDPDAATFLLPAKFTHYDATGFFGPIRYKRVGGEVIWAGVGKWLSAPANQGETNILLAAPNYRPMLNGGDLMSRAGGPHSPAVEGSTNGNAAQSVPRWLGADPNGTINLSGTYNLQADAAAGNYLFFDGFRYPV